MSPRTYLLCLLGLLALTALSFGMSRLDLGTGEMFVALGIAVVKGALVAMIFMHLLKVRGSVLLALLAAVAFVSILVALMAGDVATRAPVEMRVPQVPSASR